MPLYVLLMIPKLGASPPDVNTLSIPCDAISFSVWKKHWIFFRKEQEKKKTTTTTNNHLLQRHKLVDLKVISNFSFSS